jgi:hypothetical protein
MRNKSPARNTLRIITRHQEGIFSKKPKNHATSHGQIAAKAAHAVMSIISSNHAKM